MWWVTVKSLPAINKTYLGQNTNTDSGKPFKATSTEWDWDSEDLGFLSQTHPTSLDTGQLALGELINGGLHPGSLAPSLPASSATQTVTQPTPGVLWLANLGGKNH